MTPYNELSFGKEWLATLPNDVEIHVTVDTVINPTEDPEKVFQAARLISQGIDSFPYEITDQGAKLILAEMSNRVIRQQIMDAARKHLLDNYTPELGMTVAFINKQVALHGRLNLSEEAPMSPITMKIVSNRMDQVLNHYFPKAEWRFPRKSKKKTDRHHKSARRKTDEIIEEINLEDIDLDNLDDEESE